MCYWWGFSRNDHLLSGWGNNNDCSDHDYNNDAPGHDDNDNGRIDIDWTGDGFVDRYGLRLAAGQRDPGDGRRG